jgi:hypothetical protein
MPLAVSAIRSAWSCFSVSDAMEIFACFELPVFVGEILADLSVFYANSFVV